jgi:SAM-dependent methyltransferase
MAQTPTGSAREQFGRQAAVYARGDVHNVADTLQPLIDLARPGRGLRAVDVGTGAGFTAFELAQHGAHTVAYDPTVPMLQQARRLAAERNLSSIRFSQGTAEALAFPDNSLDIYTCRLAAHHFASLPQTFSEAFRVLRSGGTAVFLDIAGTSDHDAERWQDEVERLRDPSHQRDYTEAEWVYGLQAAGFQVNRVAALVHQEPSMVVWAERSGDSPETIARLLALFGDAPASAISAFNISPASPLPLGEGQGEGPRDYSFTWPVVLVQAVCPA